MEEAPAWILVTYQARNIFGDRDPVLTESSPTQRKLHAAAQKLGGVTVVKAQVKTGGRGKAGGVKVAKTPADARRTPKAAG